MANETPESELSIECFQNYSAGEVFIQGLAGIVDQTDVETLIRHQKTILQTDDELVCACCESVLMEPYIDCCDCEAVVCTVCYTRGRETLIHHSDHTYRIIRNDFPIFENCNWSAKEELNLLKAISMHGYGNWEEISKYLQTRNAIECEIHYKKYYIDNVQIEELSLFPHTMESVFPQPVIPFLVKRQQDSRYCPRFCESNLAGYNAFRSEFGFNYDHHAERLLNVVSNVDYEDDLMSALTVTIGHALNSKLKERKRRYDILKNHGLIMLHKLSAWCQKFYPRLGKGFVDRMLRFMQLMTGLQFDIFMEQLNFEQELSIKISRLSELRRNGIKTHVGAKIYKRLSKSDDDNKTIIKAYVKDYKAPGISWNLIDSSAKRSVKPLEIEDMPGYQCLNSGEKNLCSLIRLPPQKYLEIREQLMQENTMLGYLRLSNARRIARIDVNKTRKVYDFLAKEGFISVPQ